MRVARPVRGRLTRVIPFIRGCGATGQRPAAGRILEGVIRGFYPIGHAVRKTGDGEIPRSGRLRVQAV